MLTAFMAALGMVADDLPFKAGALSQQLLTINLRDSANIVVIQCHRGCHPGDPGVTHTADNIH